MKRRVDRKKALALIKKGNSDMNVARKLGCHSTTITYIRLREFGMKRRGLPRKGTKAEEIRTMLRSNPEMSYAELGKMLGTHKQYVYMVAKSSGFPTRVVKRKPSIIQHEIVELISKLERLGGIWSDEDVGVVKHYHMLRRKGIPIRRFGFNAHTFYYMEHKKQEAYDVIRKRIGRDGKFTSQLKSVHRMFFGTRRD